MHIAHPHKQDEIEPDSGDSEYDNLQGDIGDTCTNTEQ